MKKSLSKRIRITKNGKMLRRSGGVDHFRTRKSKKAMTGKKTDKALNYPKKKILNQYYA